ncbi:uncharacterized protein LY89DRAFT_734998 [Mollisia scopiformis]|uniref:Uncharacterized protein n=1 Tax=Mollisia scopiformis TaxID=149040 RepID=A0A194X7R3_MOLSC|nr:uncharacterized protein LY89DRAFT_734998 [Mollisia scopiformis]KUJ15852.1 hypothetical protein LY89DRAFT_734998 [Mollisia scopiformis]
MSPTPRTSRKSQRTSPYPTKTSHSPAMNSKATLPKPFISSEAFLSNLIFSIVIQDDEDIFELVFDRSFSHDLNETANGTHLTFNGMKEFTSNLRSDISDRRLVSESFVVMVGDPEGLTGTVAHSFQFTGTQAAENMKSSVVAVVNVSLDEEQQRKIKMESFVFRTDKL